MEFNLRTTITIHSFYVTAVPDISRGALYRRRIRNRGLVEKSESHGILFARLNSQTSSGGQELLFYLMDTGQYPCKMGLNTIRKADIPHQWSYNRKSEKDVLLTNL